MNKLYLDIETLPASEKDHKVLKLLHKKAQAKDKAQKKDFEQYLLETSFDGAFGKILCIGYATNDQKVEILYAKDNESEILEKFWEIAKNADLFIGHNVMDFDLRFIYQRSIINKVIPSRELIFARYRSYPIYDTMKEWVKWSMTSVGLDHLVLALGIETSKDNLDGSQVYDFYKAGRVEEILDYCKKDVEVTRKVYKRLTFSN